MNVLRLRSRFDRRGAATQWVVAVVAAAAVVGWWWLREAGTPPTPNDTQSPLLVYCAAGIRPAFESIRREYEQAYGVPLQVQYGPSQTLLAGIEVSQTGDLYLPADDGYIAAAQAKNLAAEVFPLATMKTVVAVPKGNPKRIAQWNDLLREDVRIAQASPDGAAIGKLTREALSALGLWDALDKKTTVYATTVTEAATAVKVGGVDAGIVFDAVLHDFDSLEAVTLPELQAAEARVAATVLRTSRQPRQALHFARYLSARDKGLAHYRRFGFVPLEGDVWSDEPEVTLYAGSMLRPAIEATITAFEQREGVRVLRVYNGCGVLVAQMKAGTVPDAYFACDVEFMQQVRELFPASEDVSQNELVILVKKGNPSNIASLVDLSRDGLRVGIGHEKQCAMGWLTQRTFREGGVQDAVMKNVVVQTPTGDMLVNQMRSGSLDAAVAYLSNAAGSAQYLDAVRISGLPCAVATQPFAAAANSPHKRTMQRLLQAIRAEASQQRFQQEGFRLPDAKATKS